MVKLVGGFRAVNHEGKVFRPHLSLAIQDAQQPKTPKTYCNVYWIMQPTIIYQKLGISFIYHLKRSVLTLRPTYSWHTSICICSFHRCKLQIHSLFHLENSLYKLLRSRRKEYRCQKTGPRRLHLRSFRPHSLQEIEFCTVPTSFRNRNHPRRQFHLCRYTFPIHWICPISCGPDTYLHWQRRQLSGRWFHPLEIHIPGWITLPYKCLVRAWCLDTSLLRMHRH